MLLCLTCTTAALTRIARKNVNTVAMNWYSCSSIARPRDRGPVPRARLAQVRGRGHLGDVQILAHQFLVRKLARAFLGFCGRVPEVIVRRDVLVEREGFEGDVLLGLAFGECELRPCHKGGGVSCAHKRLENTSD